MTNLNKAKLNLKLAKIFIHVAYYLKTWGIRAEYRHKLYLSRANAYTSIVDKEITVKEMELKTK